MEMMWILGGVVLVLYIWYTRIISRKNSALEALSGIDVQLKKRSNLIPNILTIAKKFMGHEKELITAVTELRAQADSEYDTSDPGSISEHLKSASALGGQMGRLMVSMEAYPDLKSDQTMLQAQQTYNEVEAQISAARRFYNSSVTELNNSIEIFPGNYLAGLAKATAMPFYEADEQSKAPIDASDYLS